jgi:hypothetical protein
MTSRVSSGVVSAGRVSHGFWTTTISASAALITRASEHSTDGRLWPMPPIYIPSSGPHDWQWLLAKPGLQWKHGASAMALADAWESAQGWPPEVNRALQRSDLADLDLLLALPEHQTPLPGGRAASQTDLLVLARQSAGGLVVLAVEGKAREPFGEDTVAAWRVPETAGRKARLAYLLELLGLADDERTDGLRYQLLHRAAAALIEAERFGAADAVLLVHAFKNEGAAPDEDANFSDFSAFADALGTRAAAGAIVPAKVPGSVRLHLGWVDGTPFRERPRVPVGQRFDRAVAFARELHTDQRRKGTDIPYVAHLLAVASLVLEDGGSEDEAIAAMLHDAVEDQGGPPTLRRIEQQFGRNVARIVEACSDTDVTPKPPWRERKEAYVAHLAHADASTLRVSLADKLHNARAILFDTQVVGDDVWTRFSAGRDEVIWYYGALAEAFAARDAGPMVAELRRTVEAIKRLAS